MPVYAYRALTAAGRSCAGVVDADSAQAAWQALRARGVYPDRRCARTASRVRGAARAVPAAGAGGGHAPARDAGRRRRPGRRGARGRRRGDRAPAPARARSRASAPAVREGRPLADALGDAARRLSAALPRAGARRRGGRRARRPSSRASATHLERSAALRARLRAALAYPAVMAVARARPSSSSCSPGWCRRWRSSSRRPARRCRSPTRALLAAGERSRRDLVGRGSLALAVAGVSALRALGRDGAAGARASTPGCSRLPGRRPRGRRGRARARRAHALDRCSPAACASRSRSTSRPPRPATRASPAALAAAREAVRQGQPLAPALRASGVVPPLARAARRHRRARRRPRRRPRARGRRTSTRRSNATSPRATALVEPALVLVMGAVVLLLVLTVLVPLVQFDPLAAS